jgi:hypothetical protein
MIIMITAMLLQTTKRPSIPFHIISREANTFFITVSLIYRSLGRHKYFMIRLRTSPLAATEAICPETLALTACIKNMLWGSSLRASF